MTRRALLRSERALDWRHFFASVNAIDVTSVRIVELETGSQTRCPSNLREYRPPEDHA
jgi:hypothetical protein